jgi:hypothetical protein
MFAEQLMDAGAPTLELHLTLPEVLAEMDASHRDELVLLDDDHRPVCTVDRSTAQQTLHDGDDFETAGTQHYSRVRATAGHHVFDLLRLFLESHQPILPITDAEGRYVGTLYRERTFAALGEWMTISEPGCVIVVDTDWVGYSMQEMGGVVEANGAKLLGSFIQRVPDSDRILVTLKVNEGSVPSVVRALERYGYTVAYVYLTPEQQDSDLANNYNALLRYLDV